MNHQVYANLQFLLKGIRNVSRQIKRKLLHYIQKDIYYVPKKIPEGFNPKVSIIVPNFNHSQFLKARLDSIYSQTYSNYEVILLDDCSNDDSDKILQEYVHRYPQNTTYHANKENSGSVFKQWKKGIELATGDLIWIAESDDYSVNHFLEELIKYFANEAVMLAFCRTDFVTGTPPKKVWTTEQCLSQFKLDWKKCWIKSAHKLVNEAWGIKNIVPNVSSAIFRRPQKIDSQLVQLWGNLKLYGDWVFYLKIIQGGLVAYSPDVTNFYRQHEHNTAKKIQSFDIYYREQEITAKVMCNLYKLDKHILQRQAAELYEHWRKNRGEKSQAEFAQLYDLERIMPERANRKPNILMAAFAITSGGGETFPIFLANQLKEKGYSVTFLNWGYSKTELGVRKMLSSEIPIVERGKYEFNSKLLEDFGIDIIHSHHASVDLGLPIDYSGSRRVITMHGMYEMMSDSHLDRVLPHLDKYIDHIVYTARKNITPLTLPTLKEKLVRIDNALPVFEIKPISRNQLGISDDDFLICLVSRAIPEKGWQEAIAAVELAKKLSNRKIHLIIIGDGQEYNHLGAKFTSDFIHFLGFKSNIRDYFAASDLGLIPSRFKGESFPLVLIDCLLSGKPVLASNIGEIHDMLQTKDGLAGEVFNLENWTIPVPTLGGLIANMANDNDYYQTLLKRVPIAAEKFSIENMVVKYEDVYKMALQSQESKK